MSDEIEGISLKKVVGGIERALREAKQLGDIESAKLMEVYRNEPSLSSFSVPAFTISDVDLELRFSIVEPAAEEGGEEEIPDIKVNISSDLLKGLESHQISVMRLKILPVSMRVLEESK